MSIPHTHLQVVPEETVQEAKVMAEVLGNLEKVMLKNNDQSTITLLLP